MSFEIVAAREQGTVHSDCFVTYNGSVAKELGKPETEEAGDRLTPKRQALTASA